MTQNGLASLAPPRVAAVVNPSAGHPTSGSWLKGQQVLDSNGALWLCQSSGTPGTWVQLSVGAGNVDSFNGRVGAVTLQEADVLATFSQKGGVMLGTGAGSGQELAPGTNGSVLLADSSQPGGARWGNPALSYAAGNLGANYTPNGSVVTTFLTSASLAVGIWLVDLTATINVGVATSIEILAAVGTATATFQGSTSCDETINGISTVGLSFIANVTAAGTLLFQTIGSGTIYSATPTHGYSNATGYTAVKIG